MPKAQETILELDLSALRHNLAYLRSRIKAETKFMAVVKAFAYGSDAVAIAHCLEKEGVDYFAVAYTSEGIALRQGGIKTPILVLHPLPVHFEELIAHHLEPNLYNKKVFSAFLETAHNKGVSGYPVHLKFNTGLNRVGLDAKDLTYLITELANTTHVEVVSLFSHLVASEDHEERNFTLEQIHSFKAIADEFIKRTGKRPLLHQLNTSGILNYADVAQFEMVRSGIGLYGFGNEARFDAVLKPIATLKSVISQIHHITKGESVGYNRGFIASEDTTTATIPLGHADGIGRQYGQGKGFVTINGHRAYIIGNVCMDMLMVNVTDIPCQEGDEVIVFGPNHSANDLAEAAGTISYELVTGLSQRIRRVLVES